jgi:hypothetical protein
LENELKFDFTQQAESGLAAQHGMVSKACPDLGEWCVGLACLA